MDDPRAYTQALNEQCKTLLSLIFQRFWVGELDHSQKIVRPKRALPEARIFFLFFCFRHISVLHAVCGMTRAESAPYLTQYL